MIDTSGHNTSLSRQEILVQVSCGGRGGGGQTAKGEVVSIRADVPIDPNPESRVYKVPFGADRGTEVGGGSERRFLPYKDEWSLGRRRVNYSNNNPNR